jgi:xanthine dehydrogenase iron-sulfur cluster and FAD-binding subunit A
LPVSAAAGTKITTLAGLGTPDKPHPLQTAFIAEQVPQCGYCLNGWIDQTANPQPDPNCQSPRLRLSARRAAAAHPRLQAR